MNDDHLEFAGLAEIPKPHKQGGPVHFQSVSYPIPRDKREPVVTSAIYARLERMLPGECFEVDRGPWAMRQYCFRFRAETNRRHWRFRVRKVHDDRSRVWRIPDVAEGT